MDEEPDAYYRSKTVKGTIQCDGDDCSYWGEMVGHIEPDKPRAIQFVCPKCNTITLVGNIFL